MADARDLIFHNQ